MGHNLTMSVGVPLLSLLAALFGGAAVSLVNYLANRGRTKAEIAKLNAEADHVRAETATLAIGGSPTGGQQINIPGWRAAGSRPDDYVLKLDRSIVHGGGASASIEARPGARGFATLMQSFNSDTMHGKRIRMSAFVRTEDVEYATLWMRVDGRRDIILAFDNMSDRLITGTTSWQAYEIVLDVEKASRTVTFGVILASRGRVWVDNFNFEPVEQDVATTDNLGGNPELPTPWNLDFEQ